MRAYCWGERFRWEVAGQLIVRAIVFSGVLLRLVDAFLLNCFYATCKVAYFLSAERRRLSDRGTALLIPPELIYARNRVAGTQLVVRYINLSTYLPTHALHIHHRPNLNLHLNMFSSPRKPHSPTGLPQNTHSHNPVHFSPSAPDARRPPTPTSQYS